MVHTKSFNDIKAKYHNAFEAMEVGDISEGPDMLYAFSFVNFINALKEYESARLEEEEIEELLPFGALVALLMDEFTEKFGIDKIGTLKRYGILED